MRIKRANDGDFSLSGAYSIPQLPLEWPDIHSGSRPDDYPTTDCSQADRRPLPTLLEVINESHMHRVEPGSESHFKVVIVCEQFAGQRLLARHRQVNAILADELAGAVHALALHTYTENEWQEKGNAPRTPSCVGKPSLS